MSTSTSSRRLLRLLQQPPHRFPSHHHHVNKMCQCGGERRSLSTSTTPHHQTRRRHFSTTTTTTTTSDKSKSSSPPPTKPKIVGILGGGITGLSTAYYLTQRFGPSRVTPVILESSDRVGGWVRTVVVKKGGRNNSSGSLYEIGPRSIRPVGLSGMNTLDLVEELKLDKQVLYVEKSHPTARNRMIYVNGKLVRLPADASVMFKKQEPFSKPLVFALLRDLVAVRKRLPDDSIHNFVLRRFGPEVANYLIDPLIRGICAGDSKQISVNFLMKQLFELEQSYGSVVLGTALSTVFRKMRKATTTELGDDEDDLKLIGFSNIAAASTKGNWSVWSLEEGLEALPRALERHLEESGVQIRKNTKVVGIDTTTGGVDVRFSVHGDKSRVDSLRCDHVVSAIPATKLGEVFQASSRFRELAEICRGIPSESLQVTGVTYDDDDNDPVIDSEAFGFLVPSFEKSVDGLLGVVFDTQVFPQHDGKKTVITVMSRKKQEGSSNNNNGREEHSVVEILAFLNKTLGIEKEPSDVNVAFLRECIPQYLVGHLQRVEGVKKALPQGVTVAGASWDGVSVNDCVLGGRKAAGQVGRRLGILGSEEGGASEGGRGRDAENERVVAKSG